MKKEETGRIIADVGNPSLKAMKWLILAGTFTGAAVAIFASLFSMNVGPDAMPFTIIFMANVPLFIIAGILVWLWFSSREMILYENGMKIPKTRFSSRYIRYDEVKSIDSYARGGKVIIRTENGDFEVTKGIIEKWDDFIRVLKDKGLINENGVAEP